MENPFEGLTEAQVDELLSGLTYRERDIIIRRYGLKGQDKEDLEAVARTYGITRERVRQVERNTMNKLRPRIDAIK